MIRFLLFSSWVVVLGMTVVKAEEFPPIYNSPSEAELSPMPADEAAQTMEVPEGFRAQLFAAEPDVQNPIAIAWDQHRRMWVAENYTYSDRSQRFDLSLRDRVVVLKDRDGDGRADWRHVFTDQVQMLTSIEIGRGGVWLMCPPRLLFIPDADQDAVADGPAQVVLDGFTVAQDNYHNFANGLRWGPDGWLYGRCGHSCPGRIGPPSANDQQRVPIDGGIWRYHPERKVVEVLCHGTVNPWGHDWDRNGELFFINTVIGHVWHVMPGAHFTESFGESLNPYVYERMDTIADHLHFDTNSSWSENRDGRADDLGGGHAHIGMMICQSETWPDEYRNKLFTLNMHGRRANVERLERLGAGYVARHEPDFLVSHDPFFRGIDIRIGPDGDAYVVDWSDTGECHEHTGVHRTSGRIFKISHSANSQGEPPPWHKPACVAGDGVLPELWQRYQSGETTRDELREKLRDPDPHVRAWAIRLLTDFWPLDTILGPSPGAIYPEDPETRSELVRLAHEDASSLVQLVLASTLQRMAVKHRAELAAALMQHAHYADDRDLPRLVWYGLIPLAEQDPTALAELTRVGCWPKTQQFIARRLASGADTPAEALSLVMRIAITRSPAIQSSVLLGMRDAFRGLRSATRPDGWSEFRTSRGAQQYPDVVRRLNQLFGDGLDLEEIRQVVADNRADMQTRCAALQTLIDARPDDLQDVCRSLINTRVLNATAAQGLALFDDPDTARLLARRFRRFHPDDRPGILDLLVSRPTFAAELLKSIRDGSGQISASQVTAFHARQIRSLGDAKLNELLREVWGELRNSSEERRALMHELKHKLTATPSGPADLRNGRALFQTRCAQCHRLFGEGAQIGPDLTGSQRSDLDYLLENIVDPSAVVGKDYRMTIVTTSDGRVLNGLVVAHRDATLELQTQSDRLTIPMTDVDQIKTTSHSSMPDGLLDNLTEDEIRDLFAYLRHPSQVPLPAQ